MKLCGVLAIHSKDASGPKEHARPGIGPPARALNSYALHKVYEFVESITREGNFVEFWQSTQKKSLELRNTLDPELDLQHAAFMSYSLHKLYEFVESITREGNFVEFWQSTQKMRLDLRNTLDSEFDL